MVRVFRAGVLPFSTLSKNRDGGEFRCELNPGEPPIDGNMLHPSSSHE